MWRPRAATTPSSPTGGEAIRQAVLGCSEPSVLLITGKGAETRQKRGTEYIDTPSDVDYVHTFLQEYDVKHGLDGMEKVRSLLSILPILKRDEGRTVVVKYGGSALGAEAATDTTLQDVAALRMVGVRVVLVHGGGKHITAADRHGPHRRGHGAPRCGAASTPFAPGWARCPFWTAGWSTPCCWRCLTSGSRGPPSPADPRSKENGAVFSAFSTS